MLQSEGDCLTLRELFAMRTLAECADRPSTRWASIWREAAELCVGDVLRIQHCIETEKLDDADRMLLRNNRALLLGHSRWQVQLLRVADWDRHSFPDHFCSAQRVLPCDTVGCGAGCSIDVTGPAAFELLCGCHSVWSKGWKKNQGKCRLRKSVVEVLEEMWPTAGGEGTPAVIFDADLVQLMDVRERFTVIAAQRGYTTGPTLDHIDKLVEALSPLRDQQRAAMSSEKANVAVKLIKRCVCSVRACVRACAYCSWWTPRSTYSSFLWSVKVARE
jgi:hypothetical protein